jgi:hypothetical protein
VADNKLFEREIKVRHCMQRMFQECATRTGIDTATGISAPMGPEAPHQEFFNITDISNGLTEKSIDCIAKLEQF